MADELIERKLFATFDKLDEFLSYQSKFLSYDLKLSPSADEDKEELVLFNKLCNILDSYQEQSFLLDPHLEGLVTPVVDSLKRYATSLASDPSIECSSTRVTRTALLMYQYVKCRGYKTIIRFLPHEIADLSLVLGFLQRTGNLASDPEQWSLRYIFLIWLSLICMLPFDLAQFDEVEGENSTAKAIEAIGKNYLTSAGLERHGGALLLSRLYMREDTLDQLRAFMTWTIHTKELFSVIGALQVHCEILKSGPAAQVQVVLSEVFSIVSMLDSTLASNTVVRKYKTKLISRAGLRMIPTKPQLDDGADVPDTIEQILEQLFESLQDKDTIVRWSAAKGVARIASALPADFADQVLSTVMGLFSLHSIAAATIYDMPAVAESTWHGACLACAEMARRGLVRPELLSELVDWLSKGLYFDLRKGAHSIGSNVRDASAYVIWSLARSKEPSELAPYADRLARQLATVALFDREIHIRRAASAAFQENVGRTSLFPHGIDVLRKTDFYSVSVRRNAYLVAAPQVAEHPEYRPFLVDHLTDVPLRHWDPAMRSLTAQSIRLICLEDMEILPPQVFSKANRLLESTDNTDIHGGLLALTELSIAFRETARSPEIREKDMRNIFKSLSAIPYSVLVGPRNEIITAAACEFIAQTVTLSEIELHDRSSVPKWRQVLDHGLKHRSIPVQEAAANGIGAISKLVDCSSVVRRLIRELTSGSSASQQSLGRVLGSVAYDKFPACLPESIECLLNCVKPSTTGINANLEARHNCYKAIPKIVENVAPHLTQHLTPGVFNSLLDALITGLDDYTVDERGDVGSWIRITCIGGLTTITEILVSRSESIDEYSAYMSPETYHTAVTGILKQGLERLDNVRHEAGECMMRLLRLSLPNTDKCERWTLPSVSLLRELFIIDEMDADWSNGNWLFPRAVRLLDVEFYRHAVLQGLITSLGSKTESTHKPVSSSLVAHIKSLPYDESNPAYDLVSFVKDLIKLAKTHFNSNGVVVPVLQAFNILLEGGALSGLGLREEGRKLLVVLQSMVSRHVEKLKNVQRIHESMKIIVNLLAFAPIVDQCIVSLINFLGHQFPSVRSETAEYLYLTLQSIDIDRETDEVEEVLLETEWSSTDHDAVMEKAQNVVDLFQSHV
ncbi:ARM repeat-containing protein [Mucidula mucida]|nr:ARM repeat-containing protein [Mucidula mucida]